MRSIETQRGEGRLSFVFWLVVIAIAGMIGFEAIPVRYRMAQLQDFMVESAERARFNNARQIEEAILRKARSLDLPLVDKALDVTISGGKIRIDADYTVTLDFMFTSYDWHKKHHIDRSIYYW